MADLDPAIHAQISKLCSDGEKLLGKSHYGQAVAAYEKALSFLPEPHENWEASTWILTAIGDAHYLAGDLESARRALQDAMHCPGAIGNPFIHLRLGQVQLELGNVTRAKDELARAYMGGGEELFRDEDGKYLTFVKSFMTL